MVYDPGDDFWRDFHVYFSLNSNKFTPLGISHVLYGCARLRRRLEPETMTMCYDVIYGNVEQMSPQQLVRAIIAISKLEKSPPPRYTFFGQISFRTFFCRFLERFVRTLDESYEGLSQEQISRTFEAFKQFKVAPPPNFTKYDVYHTLRTSIFICT